MKKSVKFILGIMFFVILIFLGNDVYAADANISAGKTSLEIGESTDITVSVSQTEAWSLTVSGSGGNLTGTLSSADAIGEEVSKSVISAQFSASVAGTYTISLSGSITGSDLVKKTVSQSVQITVKEATPKPEPETPTTPSTPSKSSDTSLKSLSISPFGKINKASTGIYDITVENSLEKVTITAVANHSAAKIVSGNGTFDLEEGTNNFKVVVKAEDGSEETHKIRIIRKAAETVEPISPPNVIEKEEEKEEPKEEEKKELGLSNLVITGVELNPTFSMDVYEYTAEFSEDIDTLEVIATANLEGATVEVAGNTNLKIGENLITIIVKSEDGKTTKTYQVTVTKNEPEVVAATTTDDNTVVTDLSENQELKNRIGKIVLIALAAIIAVILIGIIVIINTRKKLNQNIEEKRNVKKNKLNKEDFTIAVNEDDAYRELEKLSNIHNANTIFNEDDAEIIDDGEQIDSKFNEEISEEITPEIDNVEPTQDHENLKQKNSKGKRFK